MESKKVIENHRQIFDGTIDNDENVARIKIRSMGHVVRRVYFITNTTPINATLTANECILNKIKAQHIVFLHEWNGTKVYRLDLFELDSDLPLLQCATPYNELSVFVHFEPPQESDVVANFAMQYQTFQSERVVKALMGTRLAFPIKRFGHDNILTMNGGAFGIMFYPVKENDSPHFPFPIDEQKRREQQKEFDSWIVSRFFEKITTDNQYS